MAIKIAGFEAKDSIVDCKVLISTESVEGLSLSFFSFFSIIFDFEDWEDCEDGGQRFTQTTLQ